MYNHIKRPVLRREGLIKHLALSEGAGEAVEDPALWRVGWVGVKSWAGRCGRREGGQRVGGGRTLPCNWLSSDMTILSIKSSGSNPGMSE